MDKTHDYGVFYYSISSEVFLLYIVTYVLMHFVWHLTGEI